MNPFPHPISGCPECCHALQPPNLQNCQQLDANHPRSWQKLKGLVQAQGEIFRKPWFLSSLEGLLCTCSLTLLNSGRNGNISAMPSFWVTNKSNLPRSCQGFHYTHYLELNLSRSQQNSQQFPAEPPSEPARDVPCWASNWPRASSASCSKTSTPPPKVTERPTQIRSWDKERVMKNWNITEMAVWMVLEAQNAERLDKTRGFYAQGNHRDHAGALE